ncbi:SidA/IucD/PvdA family monooxygenase [Streptomyces sp. SID5606]|uniref:lysine N(6)-hydroxylase/L-ornithine N(5)-oxygenase family protein n=1 Tax=Streptomyces sp. SID5606 TaxID=2690305 RepID=UPI00136ED8E9|nr:SidA/IucD/PvdA family monooxygenase [Streptomyces sp. SID5606]MZD56775.1 SidA/IucD/PvdA family monooxygenase [Streptomyces sp. SID5606]
MSGFDLIGIGIGPANLSLAALSEPITEVRSQFLDSKPEFRWHPGLMLPDSQLTVTYFRDLVTLVDPRSKFSFLNFLVESGRAFRFLEANGLSCSRREFEQYYQWAAAQLPSLRWGKRVESVFLTDDGFRITTEGGDASTARNLVLGTGAEPRLPNFAKAFEGERVVHSSNLTVTRPEWKGRRVLVVGSGQSGAEVVHHILSDDNRLPSSLTWTSSHIGFQPLDDSPFTNEWFSPNFVGYFNGLPAARRAEIVREQHSAGGDGVTDELLGSVYRRLYHLDHVLRSDMAHRLLACRRAVGLERSGSEVVVDLRDVNRGDVERLPVDLVIFCTGYHNPIPEYLKPIQDKLSIEDGTFLVRPDYSVEVDGPEDLRIYVQGFAESSHGINDTLLSLASWRSAGIVNSVVGREVYRVDGGTTTVAWQ